MISTLQLESNIARKFSDIDYSWQLIKKFRPDIVCKWTEQTLEGPVATYYLDDVLNSHESDIIELKQYVLNLEDRLNYLESILNPELQIREQQR